MIHFAAHTTAEIACLCRVPTLTDSVGVAKTSTFASSPCF